MRGKYHREWWQANLFLVWESSVGRTFEHRLRKMAQKAVGGRGWTREDEGASCGRRGGEGESRSGFGGRERKERRKEERSTHLLRSHATHKANQNRSLSSK